MMEIKMLALELEQWAAEKGWKTVTQLITPHHYGNLLESLEGISEPEEFSRRLHNNKQILQRAFRGDTPTYHKHAAALSYAVRVAIEEQQAQQHDEHHLAAVANRECIEATSAVLLRKPQAVIYRETVEAINQLAKFLPGVKVQLVHSSRHAV